MNKIIIPLIMALALLLGSIAQAQVPVALSPVPSQQFFSNAGVPLASGCINTYITGTSTPLATYTDGTGTATNPNPIILDAGGYANIWLKNSSYRFTITSTGGVNCSTGTFQRTVDNISAYTVINQAQNIFLSCQSSDPSGSAGELGCRSDLSNKARYFSTLWDSLVTETGTATLTNKTLSNPVSTGTDSGTETLVNKTLTSPALNTPSINGTVVTGPPATYLVMTNDLVTGTTLNKLAKINPAGLAGFAILPLITDTGGVTGIVVAGAGVTLNATIQQSGSASCVFDNAVTSGDYAQISATVSGDCHDSGVSFPTTGQVIGRVLATNASAGTYFVDLFGPEIKFPGTAASIVFSTPSASTNGNIATTVLATAGVSGNTYRLIIYVDTTVAGVGCTTNGTITFSIISTDPNAGSSTNAGVQFAKFGSAALSGTLTIVNNGTVGDFWVMYADMLVSKASTPVQYSTTFTPGTCATSQPFYQVYPVLEQLK